jgi:hypothetical protein
LKSFSQKTSDLTGWTTLFGLDFANQNNRTANYLGQTILSQIQDFSPLFYPISKG